MPTHKISFLLATLLCTISSIGQIDINSYLKQIDTIKVNKDRVKAYLDISWEYYLIENDSALIYADKAYEIAASTNDHFGMVISLESKGLYYDSVNNDYEKATNIYMNAIDIAETNNLNYSNSLYISLGIIFQMTEDHETAARYFEESISISRQNNDTEVLKYGLVNYGTALGQLNRLDQAEQVYLECLSLNENNVEADLSSYSNLANIYDRKGDYEKASIYHEKSLQFPKDEKITIRYLPLYAATLDNNIKRKDPTGIDSLITRLYDFANSGSSLHHKITAYDALTRAHIFKEEYQPAAITAQKSKQLSDSLYELNLKETTYELERKYENERNRQTLEKQRNTQKIYTAGVAILASFLLLLGYFFYKRSKTNQLLSRQKLLLEKTIDQKNILLKETHHRVKNSFQMVSSLLYIQGETTQQVDAQIALKEAQNRVRSMVLTHQKLYNTEDLIGINTKDYITDLTNDVINSYTSQNNINTRLNIESHILDIDTITPLGIIINELVTNIFKHAFNDQTANPKIEVDFTKKKELYSLKIKDNGIGISKNRRDGALGLELLKSLASKINGAFSINALNNHGTIAIIEFSLNNSAIH